MGFFAASEMRKGAGFRSLIPHCGKCGLYKSCNSPKMEPRGEFRRKVLVVGEAPGDEDDAKGRPFAGKTGQLLRSTLKELGVSLERDCLTTNAIVCRTPNSRAPESKEIQHCQANYLKTLQHDPDVILCLGNAALEQVLSTVWEGKPGGVMKWSGANIPCRNPNVWIVPTFHPSYVAKELDGDRGAMILRRWKNHLKKAFAHRGKPHDSSDPIENLVERVFDTDRAEAYIEELVAMGEPFAFDYETNMLKPDSEQSRIVSCSISTYSRHTFAFLWTQGTAKLMRELLRTKALKIAANLKFEDRWSRRILKTPVRNWAWDTLVNAHIEDHRKGTNSLTYQAFIRFGVVPYERHISPFLSAPTSYATNRIHEISEGDLLLYNGLDSLLEYWLAVLQTKHFNHPLHRELT